MNKTALNQLLDALTRIQKQNQEILDFLSAKANRKYFPLEDAAERLDRSVWTLRQLCNMGQIRAVKDDSGHWRIPAEEMARLDEEGVPKLPTKTLSSSRPLSRRGKGADSAVSSLPSGVPSISI